MTTLNRQYPIGSYVTTGQGIGTVLGHDEMSQQLRVLTDYEAWIPVEEVLRTADVPDLNDPDSIEEFLNRVEIHDYDKPPATGARSVPCRCDCPPGACYRVSSNDFHMTNGDCRCEERNCECI